jgi:hypothetical protein
MLHLKLSHYTGVVFAPARQKLQDCLAQQRSRQAELEAVLLEIEAMEKKAAKPR